MRIRLLSLALIFVLAACNLPATGAPVEPTPDIELLVQQTQTAIAGAISGQATSTALNEAAQATVRAAAGLSTPGAATPQPPAGVTLPPPQATQPVVQNLPNCTNLAKFVTETVPDGSIYPPNTPFIKTWTIQNAGTCTWTPEYALVFSRGEQMGGSSPQPIGQTVPPGGAIQIFLPQTSPAAAGEHQGFWMLRSTSAGDFALGADGSKAFWTKIVVNPNAPAPSQAAPTPASSSNLGPPTQTWSFNNGKSPVATGNDGDTSYELTSNMLVMTAHSNGDMWRVVEGSYIDNFAIEARFLTGNICSGRDAYGLLVRAPSQPDNIIDTGYVFTFNCDGQFRAYRMDNGAYTGLYNWTTAPSIKTGPNQVNVMTITGQGAIMTLFANGQALMQLNDLTYEGGLFGLIIGASNTQNLQVAVQQLSWWDLP
jgi:hypothetical protein